MAEHGIPVDPFNPGQVFACLGLLEAADILIGDAEGGFDWSYDEDVRFRLRAAGGDNPVAAVLQFLAAAEVSSLAPPASAHSTARWAVPTTTIGDDDPFPFPDPSSPATLPGVLSAGGKSITIDHWGDASSRDNVKFWAGSGGYPGAALARDALALIRDGAVDALDNPFSLSAPLSSSFRMDWRRDYVPMDVGFSPNVHGDLVMVGYPLVEVLAVIGVANARPERVDRLTYRYGVVGAAENDQLLDPVFLRAALGGAQLPFPQRVFQMSLDWPGQEGQARCIVKVTEETDR